MKISKSINLELDVFVSPRQYDGFREIDYKVTFSDGLSKSLEEELAEKIIEELEID
jgi:hypothetical protein